ncbi:MAG TPA: homocysteine S-methyltransferase family protein [Candidatus Sulfotelmatobacter sp.]
MALTYPNALRELHIEFREAGSEVLQAVTFCAGRDKLATVGLENRLEELNRSAVRMAREVVGDQCLVAGNLSLTCMYEPCSSSAADGVRKTFDEQLAVRVDEGIDIHYRRNVLLDRRGSDRRSAPSGSAFLPWSPSASRIKMRPPRA